MNLFLPKNISIVNMKFSFELTKTQWEILHEANCDDFINEMEKETRAEKIYWSIHFSMTIFFTLDNTVEGVETGLEKVIKFLENKLGGQ